MKKNIPIQFGLRSIKTDEFGIIESVHVGDKSVKLEHNFTFTLSQNANELAVSFKICFLSEDRPFIVLRVTCCFEIEADSFLVSSLQGSKKVEIPKDFIIHLAFLTTGTARGVLHSKLEQTPFDKYLLPIMDVTKVFTDNATFELPSQVK